MANLNSEVKVLSQRQAQIWTCNGAIREFTVNGNMVKFLAHKRKTYEVVLHKIVLQPTEHIRGMLTLYLKKNIEWNGAPCVYN